MVLFSQTTIANRHTFTDTYTNELDSNQTNKAIITPTTGKQIVVTGVYFSTEGATAAGNMVSLLLGTDTVFKVHPTTTPMQTHTGPIIVWGDVDAPLKITSNLGDSKSYFIAIDYREE